jgi:hypothetical protein
MKSPSGKLKIKPPGLKPDGKKKPPPNTTLLGEQMAAKAAPLTSVCAKDVKIKPVVWLWKGWLPRGKVGVIDGSPGLGKSTITLDLAARITSGQPMPDGAGSATGPVVLVSYEDDSGDTIVPRFLAAGGDLNGLHLVKGVQGAPFTMPEHTGKLADLIDALDAVLVVIDPLMAALSGDVKTGIDHHIRRTLAPLKSVAEATGATVMLVRHLNKQTKLSDPMMRGGGSIGIIGAARFGLIVGPDPEDDDRRVLAISKSNLADDDRAALSYRVVQAPHHDCGRIEWLGASEHDATSVLGGAGKKSKLDEAMTKIKQALALGARRQSEIEEILADANISMVTGNRAKKKLGVESVKKEGGIWWWYLPGKEEPYEIAF